MAIVILLVLQLQDLNKNDKAHQRCLLQDDSSFALFAYRLVSPDHIKIAKYRHKT